MAKIRSADMMRSFAFLSVLMLVGSISPLRTPVFAQPSPVLRLALGSSDTSAAGYIAYDAGIFKKNGLNIELIQTKGGAASAAAVAGGAAEFADGNLITFANAHIHDIPFVAVAPGEVYDSSDPYVVVAVAANSPYRSAKDLNGKVIGEPSLGGMAEVAIGTWIDKNGGDLKSIKYIEIPPSESAAALNQGRVAAAVFQDPQLSEQRSQIRVLAPAYDAVAKRRIDTVWYTTVGFANKNPDTVERFQASIREAPAWAAKNPDQAKQILGKWLKINITKIRNFHVPSLDAPLMQPLLDNAAKYGILSRKVNAIDLIYDPGKPRP
jgi:NitT/TauT family transport system substrate-binding protein